MVATLDGKGASHKHWKLMEDIRRLKVEPKTFKEKWKVTNDEMAELLQISRSTVEAWFLKSSNRRDPEPHYLAMLALINFTWESISNEDTTLERLRSFYDRVKDR